MILKIIDNQYRRIS